MEENKAVNEAVESAETTQETTQATNVDFNKWQRLNGEYGALKQKLAKIEAEQEAKEKALAEEQGKYRELYEKSQSELSTLKEQAQRLASYEETAKSKIDTILSTIPDEKKELADLIISHSGINSFEKVEKLNKLLADKTPKGSPASARAGQSTEEVDIASLSPKDRIKAIFG